MAPRKEKVEKTGTDQGNNLILDYLKKQKYAPRQSIGNASNVTLILIKVVLIRPLRYQRIYTRRSPSASLGPRIQKSVIFTNPDLAYTVKALKELHEQNLVAGKTAGKQLVYHALQDSKDAASPEELMAMEKEIQTLREYISSAKAEEKILKANLVNLNATMSTQDIRNGVAAIEIEKNSILKRLDLLRTGNVTPVSSEERAVVDQAHKVWTRHVAVRKKICMNLWGYVTEELPEGKTKEELWEERGLESDD
ncbi:hypothetical protein MMC14_008146 [Varicellaria rhodocarpa]|nr:hypothetical protein [Varicellaria rhodocarpa]